MTQTRQKGRIADAVGCLLRDPGTPEKPRKRKCKWKQREKQKEDEIIQKMTEVEGQRGEI